MPILTLKLSAQVRIQNTSVLAQALTALSHRVLHKRSDVTSVVLQRIAQGDWWVGGEVSAQVFAQLDIRITQGTNTEEEKAAFIAQAYALLSEHLDKGQVLHATSYISVQELPATDWGYGGLTQQQRRVQQTTL